MLFIRATENTAVQAKVIAHLKTVFEAELIIG